MNRYISISIAIVALLALAACAGGNGGNARMDTSITPTLNIVSSPGGNARADTSALTVFEYDYGSFNGGERKYTIRAEGAGYLFTARGYNGVDLNVEAPVNRGDLDGLAAVIRDNGIASWDGFDKRDPNILDGYGFSLSAEFESWTLEAHGYEKYPQNYEAGHAALSAYLDGLAHRFAPLDLQDPGNVYEIQVSFYDSAGRYSMEASRENTDEGQFGEYAAYMVQQYNRFKNESSGSLSVDYNEFCSIDIVTSEATNRLQNEAVISKEKYPDVYAEVLAQSLRMDGKPADYFNSEEYQTALYKDKFIYPTAWLYDKGGLGTMIVDFPGQRVTVNGVVYTPSWEDMLAFYEFVDKIPPGPADGSDIWKYKLTGGYLEEGQTAQGVFDGFVSDGNTWILGRNHIRDAFYLYGGKGGKPQGWGDVTAAFEKLIGKTG